ncbi:hypothetical protein [Massilia aerilata]|uniref:Uncharacterized protein n=1 Tax=Massilia aerilata TaxID=453817 RepID=A0ABW0S544_9BURK
MIKNSYYLRVSFDIGQESERLDWTILDSDHQPVQKSTGLETGQYMLDVNDTLRVNVVANSYLGELSSVHIIDCHLIHRPVMFSSRGNPAHLAGKYPYPSPFFNPATMVNGQGATFSFGQGQASGTQLQMSWDSDAALTILNQGRWQMSFIMTVAIETAKGLEYRVFSFDPETQVGNGSVPPDGA